MAEQETRPNILWICTDQQRYDTIHALGNVHIHTPNIDRLVAEGVAFTHAHCQSPVCTPSRASFLTGLYPSTVHGTMNGNDRWSEAAPLVTKLLTDTGYDCGLAGKLHLAGAHGRIEPRPNDDGYRVFHWSHGPIHRWPEGHAYAEWLKAQGVDLKIFDDEEGNPRHVHVPQHLHQTTWCTDRAIEFMLEERESPWLMSVNIFAPHPPYNPPDEYRARYNPDDLPGPPFRIADLAAQDKLAGTDFTPASDPATVGAKQLQADYYAAIELIDWNVGRLLDALSQSGQRENTVVLFMSDHGELLGDHGLLFKGCRFYEGLVRVPLIVSWPGHFEYGLVSHALVELIDVAPTLLESAGLSVPGHMQGRSLLPILTGTAASDDHRNFVRCEYYQALNTGVSGREEFEGTYATMIRDHRHKLIVYHGHSYGELFDLVSDPDEFENRWDDPHFREIRLDLLLKSFDALAFAVDKGPPQTRPF